MERRRKYSSKYQRWTSENIPSAKERILYNRNAPPGYVVNAESLMDFDRKLDRLWRGQDQKYDFTAQIIFSHGHMI